MTKESEIRRNAFIRSVLTLPKSIETMDAEQEALEYVTEKISEVHARLRGAKESGASPRKIRDIKAKLSRLRQERESIIGEIAIDREPILFDD